MTALDTKIEPKEKAPLPEMDTTQMTTATAKTRDDGSTYVEVLTPEGDIEVKEISPAKKKTTKRKAKASKKKPQV